MKKQILVALIALCSCCASFAADLNDHPRVAFVGPGGSSTPIDKDKYVMIVLEGAAFSHDSNVVSDAEIVPLVNSLLETKGVSYVAVYVREGTKYGEVVHGIDILRGTNAKNIGIGMKELPHGRTP
ncbi:MAG TPA: hypothetical protein VK477_02750 [Acidobacteriota bacterium]|nr:hypothetical protein [Acidobacteriota bacterium]